MARTPGARGVGVRHEVVDYPAGPGLAAPPGLGLGAPPGSGTVAPGGLGAAACARAEGGAGDRGQGERTRARTGEPSPLTWGKLPGWTRPVWGRWAEPAAHARRARSSQGPGAHRIPPALMPPAHLSARRRGPRSPLLPPPPPVQKAAAAAAAVRTR